MEECEGDKKWLNSGIQINFVYPKLICHNRSHAKVGMSHVIIILMHNVTDSSYYL